MSVPVDALREVAAQIQSDDRSRFGELVDLFATPARFPLGSDESHKYNERLFKARGEMLAILRRAGNDARITKLVDYFEGRETS